MMLSMSSAKLLVVCAFAGEDVFAACTKFLTCFSSRGASNGTHATHAPHTLCRDADCVSGPLSYYP